MREDRLVTRIEKIINYMKEFHIYCEIVIQKKIPLKK